LNDLRDLSPTSDEEELARFEFISSEPKISTYAYDSETGILSLRLNSTDTGQQGALEVSDAEGGFVLLHTRAGMVDGVEVVIWPELDVDGELDDPAVTDTGLVVPPLEIDELECELNVRVSASGAALRISVNDGYPNQTVRIADKLLLDLDEDSELTGIWMLDVPEGVAVTM
jgi:hypothetical protein